MSNTKKQIKKRKIELERLKQEVIQIKAEISKFKLKKFKRINIKNLKIIGATCKFIVPIVLMTGFIIGGAKLAGCGLPFKEDEKKHFKKYKLEYQTDGNLNQEDSYYEDQLYQSSNKQNELTIYTPWKKVENKYVRYKRKYNLGKTSTKELFDAVIEENHNYIEENLKDYQEEKQTSNTIREGDYIYKANLYMEDVEDNIITVEGKTINIVVTIIELALIIGSSFLIIITKGKDYKEELLTIITNDRINIEYLKRKLNEQKQLLEKNNQKIKTLALKVEGKTNE